MYIAIRDNIQSTYVDVLLLFITKLPKSNSIARVSENSLKRMLYSHKSNTQAPHSPRCGAAGSRRAKARVPTSRRCGRRQEMVHFL